MKKLLIILLLLGLVGGIYAYRTYSKIYDGNVDLKLKTEVVTIENGDDWEKVKEKLSPYLKDPSALEVVKDLKDFSGRVKPGKYRLEDGMSTNALVNMLRAGGQVPIKLIVNSVRTFPELAGVLGSQMQADSLEFLAVLNNDSIRQHYGFSKEKYYTLFLPNTYEIYWTKSPEEVVQRFASEFKKFWNRDRKAKAKALNLTESEIVTIASITQEEQMGHPEEWPRIAGLYLNRVRRGMALESDPTIKFAIGDFTVNRVLNEHKESTKKNPYNTYHHAGIPPGPIRMPDIRAVDAVLNAEKHAYIFMCAKKDFSGYHHFSTSLKEHNLHAKAYQNELNKRKIYR
ncbi:MAG: endolytic transglycosylase MltG [Flavobacteriales bacterium]|nr:endolytic transglycosylase MltG [Flavobacteriales bacterium]